MIVTIGDTYPTRRAGPVTCAAVRCPLGVFPTLVACAGASRAARASPPTADRGPNRHSEVPARVTRRRDPTAAHVTRFEVHVTT
ncbi:hypothetical protein EVAR_44557_1 [Eumeta japonica]|uniref:Uncharacterized protein n=1 Tax=Eumeta variegata TaxID=151549 RepID=A0A4C1X7W8_EUMVA|nr:hypothetical protein EVAR_44557_1 [Eumeta japonica]